MIVLVGNFSGSWDDRNHQCWSHRQCEPHSVWISMSHIVGGMCLDLLGGESLVSLLALGLCYLAEVFSVESGFYVFSPCCSELGNVLPAGGVDVAHFEVDLDIIFIVLLMISGCSLSCQQLGLEGFFGDRCWAS